ncbi:MAG: YncE family protein [Acidimicrobiales bacterium]
MRLPSVTSVAYGDGSLWWATGAPLGNAGTTLTPGDGRLLLRVNSTSLKVTGRFKLPGPTELVAIAQGKLWVATQTNLYRLDPSNGAILASVHLSFFPAALAGSYGGLWLYALGGTNSGRHLVVTVFSSVSGLLLDARKSANFSSGPFAVVRGGVWVPVQSTVTKSTTMRLFKGRALTPSWSLGKFTFDTNPYVGGDILWLIDAGGVGPTECASPINGVVRARGGAVGVEYGAMDFYGGSTYLLRTAGLNQSLLQIVPSARCSR